MKLAAGPLVGRLADLLGTLRLVLAVCAVTAAAAAASFLLVDIFWLFLAIALVQAAALAPTTSIADALAGRRMEYGRIRGAASAAFVVGTLIIGQLISASDLRPIIWMNVALLVMAAGATLLVPRGVPQTPASDSPSPTSVQMRGLLRLPRFRMVLLVSALIYGSHALHDGFAVIRWTAAGINPSIISFLWSEAVASEVIVFVLVGPALLDRIGVRGAAALAALAGVIRWSIAGLTNSVLVLSFLQPLHGLTFALIHLACIRVMATIVPVPLSATAQSFYAFGSALVSAAMTALSGTLYAHWGGASFFAMAVLCGVALPFAWYGFGARDRSEPLRA
jgi:MFS transporter, PPP family, 3-phenylpropionic acid transporter